MGLMRISGAVSGLDTDSIIKQLMDLERIPVTRLEARQSRLGAQQGAWRALASALGNLESRLETLAKASTFQRSGAHSSDGRVVGATSQNPPPGVYNLRVIGLASSHSVASAAFAGSDLALGLAGTGQLNGVNLEVQAQDSLATIAERINANSSYGVRAHTVGVGSGQHRLVLTSLSTGAAHAMTLSSVDGIWSSLGLTDAQGVANTVQAAADAALEVDGLAVTSASNTVTGVIPGVTLTLVGTGQAQIRTARDLEFVVTAVKEFVAAYNAAADFARTQLTHDPQGTAARPPLHAQPLLRHLHARMRSLVTGTFAGLSPEANALWQIGITSGDGSLLAGKEGRLVLNEARLREALNQNLGGVQALLGAGQGTSGLAGSLLTLTRAYTDSHSGLLRLQDGSIDRETMMLRRQVDDVNQRLVRREEHLRARFRNMELALSSLQTQSNWLNTQLTQLAANSAAPRR